MPRRSVMVVDADPGTARKVRSALDRSPFDVLPARSVQEALSLADGHDIAALLSVLSLPGGNGYDLARRIRENRPGTPVFLIWGGFDVVDGVRARAAGVTGGIRRPLTAEALLAQLESALGPLGTGAPAAPHPPVVTEELPSTNVEILGPAPRQPSLPPLVGGERLATFIPDDDSGPHVPKAASASVAAERAVLAVLPETLEVVLAKALLEPGRVRAVFEEVVRRAVEERLSAQPPDGKPR